MTTSRDARHYATRRDLVAVAWRLSGERGLTGWSLRDLAGDAGIRAPSLYVYFANKNAIFDAMFADGYGQMLEQMRQWDQQELAPVAKLRDAAHRFVEFSVDDPARMQLLFHRTIPGFTPSQQSYAAAQRVLTRFERALAEAGLNDPGTMDLWTALLTGLASQQVSNDPGGRRWLDLVDAAVDMLLGCTGQQPRA